MMLKAALVRAGATITGAELLQGLREKADGAEFRTSLTRAVEELVPEATQHHTRAIINALRADEFVTNQNGQGSNPTWVLHLEKFPEPAPVKGLTDKLVEMAEQSAARAAEDTQRARHYSDAARIIALFEGDIERALAAADIIRENAV